MRFIFVSFCSFYLTLVSFAFHLEKFLLQWKETLLILALLRSIQLSLLNSYFVHCFQCFMCIGLLDGHSNPMGLIL